MTNEQFDQSQRSVVVDTLQHYRPVRLSRSCDM